MSTYAEWLERAKAYVPTPWSATIEDKGGHLAVYVDHNDGRGPVLSMTTPSGRYAAYPEARARGYAEGLARAEAHRDALIERYATDRVCAHRSVVEPSEVAPVLSRCRRPAEGKGYCKGHAWQHS